MTNPSQEVEIRQVDKALPEQRPMENFSRQPEAEEKPKPTVQFHGTTPENMVVRPNSGSQPTTITGSSVATPETGSTELETVDTVYHTARRDNTSCREEPVIKPTQRTKERKILQYDSEESDNNDVDEQRRSRGRAEADAKAGTT